MIPEDPIFEKMNKAHEWAEQHKIWDTSNDVNETLLLRYAEAEDRVKILQAAND